MKPGSRWRILAKDGEREVTAQNEGVFDELVVDGWLHLEQMNENTWWMRVGDARLDIEVGPDGRAEVSVERGAYEQP
ncbi:MAG: hypothetical protein Q8L48_28415 [Archangium sp.]|nr:hypothetical protein [Archangium sp.]